MPSLERPFTDAASRSTASRRFLRKSKIPPAVPSTGFKFSLGSNGDMTTSATTGQALGVKLMRSYDQSPSNSVASVQSVCQIYQSRGIKPYILISSSSLNSASTIVTACPGNMPAWAAALGPGGTAYSSFPQYAQLAPEWFELGNELFYKYSPKPGPTDSFARAYATAYKNTKVAIQSSNPNVKLLFAIDTDAGGTAQYQTIVNGIYASVPDIHTYVDGWVFHIYGPMTGPNISKVTEILSLLAAKGAPSSIGVYFTEDGISTDNGPTMYQGTSPNNYGYTNPVTYDQAGAVMRQKVLDVKAQATWGSRVKLWTHYQTRDQQAPGTRDSGGRAQREWFFGVTTNTGGNKGDLTQSVRDHSVLY